MPNSRPPLKALQAFEAAARRGSFIGAAQELNVTPSAVSQQIRALELRLARPLFDRQANGVSLTLAGRRYAAGLGQAFALIDEATATVLNRRARQRLSIRVPTSFASQWIAPRLDLFRAAHPAIDIHLTALGGSLEQSAGSIDAEIRYGSGDWGKVEALELLREEVFPVCSPGLARELRRPGDLRRCELLHVPGYAEDWDAWLGRAGVRGVNTAEGLFFDQSIMAIRAAMEGKGVALGRSSLIERELAAGLLVAPFSHRLHGTGAYWFVATAQKASMPKVAAFREWLAAMARSPAPAARA